MTTFFAPPCPATDSLPISFANLAGVNTITSLTPGRDSILSTVSSAAALVHTNAATVAQTISQPRCRAPSARVDDVRRDVRAPGIDFVAMPGIVLEHHDRDVAQRHRSDALLLAAPRPFRRRHARQRIDVVLPRPRERSHAFAQRLLAILAALRRLRTVEVVEQRVVFVQQPLDANAESFALQIGQMPYLLDRRKNVAVAQPRVVLGKRAEALGQKRQHRCQIVQQLSLALRRKEHVWQLVVRRRSALGWMDHWQDSQVGSPMPQNFAASGS